MYKRQQHSAASAVLLSLILLAAGLLWTMNRQSPLKLAEQPLHLPRAAQFVPRDADLSLHWLADPGRLPAYAQAVSPASQRRDARDGARQWREGVFALAGLQFGLEPSPGVVRRSVSPSARGIPTPVGCWL